MLEGLLEGFVEVVLEAVFEIAIEIGSETFSYIANLGKEISFSNSLAPSDQIITLDILSQNKEIL